MKRTGEPVPDDEVRAAFGRLLGSRRIAPKSGLGDILRYVVEEELAGRGDRIKAYSVGVDALGRDESFDPASDSIVRVQVNRLRQTLETYYGEEGADDPVLVSIPKGSYRPRFEYRAIPAPVPESVEPDDPPPAAGPLTEPPPAPPAHPWFRRGRAVAGAAVVVAAGILALLFAPREDGVEHMDHTPILDVRSFTDDRDPVSASTVAGIREQLIVDLAHLGTVEIRDFGVVSSEDGEDIERPDYELTGLIPSGGGSPRLLLKLRAAGDGSIVWSKTLDLPDNDADFYRLLRDAVGGIAVELADTQGVVPTDIIRRLDLRVERLGDRETSEYECLLLAYTWDTTKDEDARRRADGCLSRLTADGTDSSAIWAEQALAAARTAVQLDPYNAIAHEHKGNILSALGKREEAIAAYRRGLELAPAKPSLSFLLGWQMILLDDWEGGMALVREGVERSPFPPGWMRIPLAFDAFRRGAYDESLEIAKAVIQLGDPRGHALAFGAAAAMGDETLAAEHFANLRRTEGFDGSDPFRALRLSWSDPPIMEAYERAGRKSRLY